MLIEKLEIDWGVYYDINILLIDVFIKFYSVVWFVKRKRLEISYIYYRGLVK